MVTLTPMPESVDHWICHLKNNFDDGDETNGLQARIYDAVVNDDEPDHKLTRSLIADYLRAKPSVRAVIDRTLVHITGWSLDSLLDKTSIPRKALEDFRTAVVDTGGSDF